MCKVNTESSAETCDILSGLWGFSWALSLLLVSVVVANIGKGRGVANQGHLLCPVLLSLGSWSIRSRTVVFIIPSPVTKEAAAETLVRWRAPLVSLGVLV